MLDFLGIGAQKSGTTWIYEVLRHHPGIHFPTKEVHFWDQQPCPPSEEAVRSYLQLFEVPNKKNGEITPAYAFLPVPMIQEVFRCAPSARLVYILRDPVARAWSSALMALGRAEMTFEEASDAWFIDHFTSSGSLARGDYAACLDRWLSVYPKEQLLLLRYEDINTRPEALLKSICEHVGADPSAPLENRYINRKFFEGSGHALRPSLKAYLDALYAEPKARLRAAYAIDY